MNPLFASSNGSNNGPPSCIVCMTPTDNVIPFEGSRERWIAKLVTLGVPADEAETTVNHMIIREGFRPRADGKFHTAIGVCPDCVAKSEQPAPDTSVLRMQLAHYGERMALARELTRTGRLEAETVLFDVQVAYDLIADQAGQRFDVTGLGPVRPPYPQMLMEWDMSEEPVEDDHARALAAKWGQESEPMVHLLDRKGVRITEDVDPDDGHLIVEFEPLMLLTDGSVVDTYPMRVIAHLNADGAIGRDADGTVTVDVLIDEDRIDERFRSDVDPARFRELVEDLRAPAVGGAQIALMALALMNCRNIKTAEAGAIRLRRSGTQKRRGVAPVAVRYHTIVLPGGGSTAVGSGDSSHHRATAIHRVKGHFKHFGPEFGTDLLFGKYAGTYWWGWQVRGSTGKGTVVSDYRLRHPE